MSAADVFNIDQQCKVPHCSILVLIIVVLILVAAVIATCILIRKCIRERARVQTTEATLNTQIQTMIEQQNAATSLAPQHTEQNLKPKAQEILESLNLEVSGEGLYRFEEDPTDGQHNNTPTGTPSRNNRYMDELVRQIETETVEIRKISIRRKRHILKKRAARFFAQTPSYPCQSQGNPQLDTIQQQIPSILVSSIDIKPNSPMSFSFHLEPQQCEPPP